MGNGGVLLPEDAFLEILMCLPVKSLLRFKSVCKSWYALIKSSDFIYRHANMIDSKSKLGTFICQYQHASNIDDVSQFSVLSGESLEVFEDLGNQGYCSLEPATKQCRLLAKPFINGNSHADFVAFGFDAENKDYKMLLVTSFKPKGWKQKGPLDCVRKVQIYSLSTDSWRWIDVDLPTHCPSLFDYKQGLYLNGNYFMLGVDYCYLDEIYLGMVILSFNFNKEIFRKFVAPDGGHIPSSRLTRLSSIGDKLACTKGRESGDCMLFEECWTKLDSLRPLSEYCPFGPFAFTRNGEFGFLMDQVLQSYNFASDEIEARIFGEGVQVCKVDLYKESLVSINAIGYAAEESLFSRNAIGYAAEGNQ
ncbi:hypothetical protein MKX01_019622 [Papaver californicum]|nr:hypothetical protein MKX01_019622 [Papaver californicum]